MTYKHLTTACLALVCLAASLPAKPPAPFTGTARWVDGDTLHVRVDKDREVKVRLRYADAPELAHNKRQTDQPRGKEALSFAKKKWEGKTVTVTPSGVSYGRIVATVVEKETGDDCALALASVGLCAVDQRYGKPATLLAAEAKAKKAGLGIWQEKEPVMPWDWRKQQRKRK